MNIRIKFLSPKAQMPKRATDGSVGYDCISVRKEVGDGFEKHHLGFALEVPKDVLAILVPRSSCAKTGQWMANSEGIIDPDYRGEVSAVFYKRENAHPYYVGDRVAQLVFTPCISVDFEESDALTETARGEGGYGSTGR